MGNTLKENMSTDPVTTQPDEGLEVAYARMKRENVRHLPVTDESGNVVGIISDRDFKRAMWPMNGAPQGFTTDSPNFQKDGHVAEFMSFPVKSVSEETKLLEAIHLMIDQKISALVVLRDNKMSGIVTHEDMLRLLATFLERPTPLSDKLYRFGDSTTLNRYMQLLSSAGI